ncbi:MAG: hypothetical protein U1D30_00620 [Planctomycetota bacterium]
MARQVQFTVYCSDDQARGRPARYKIAAEWTGGDYTELKTYGFADDESLQRVFADAKRRTEAIRLSEGEKLGELRVYRLEKRKHDYELERMPELERQLNQNYGSAPPTDGKVS